MRDCEMVCWLEIVRSPLQEARQWQDPSAWGTTVSLQSSAGPTTTFLEAHRTTGLPSPIALFGYSSPPIIINMSLPQKKSVQVGFHKKWYRQTHFKKTLIRTIKSIHNLLGRHRFTSFQPYPTQHCQLKFFFEFFEISARLVLFYAMLAFQE